MEAKRVLFLFSLLILGLLSDATFAGRKMVGGYEPIKDLNDPYVVDVAKFAVSEHNKQASSQLVFVKVVSGEEQVVAGTNYKLNIDAKAAGNGGNGGVYQAVVYDKPWQKYRSLTSFNKV